MTDDVKKVLNIINDDIDREALRRAKRVKWFEIKIYV